MAEDRHEYVRQLAHERLLDLFSDRPARIPAALQRAKHAAAELREAQAFLLQPIAGAQACFSFLPGPLPAGQENEMRRLLGEAAAIMQIDLSKVLDG